MRVMQLIDSLEAGGAERMAVSLANALLPHIERSYLVATRQEGPLKNALADEVGYLFLGKKRAVDLTSLQKLRKYVNTEKITHIHAHSTSFFIATQLKMLVPKIKLIWHEHHGERIESKAGEHKVLRLCSSTFHGIITVNEALARWCSEQLHCKQVRYLPNFVTDSSFVKAIDQRSKMILCLANLRAPKNHLNLLKAFSQLASDFPTWRLQLVGADYGDAYADEVQQFIKQHQLTERVELLGQRNDVKELLEQASIGVLSSDHEGLPMALLEYGAAGLAVVTTDVGQCSQVISTFGTVVPPKNPQQLAEALARLMSDQELLREQARAYQQHIKKNYSAAVILPELLKQYH